MSWRFSQSVGGLAKQPARIDGYVLSQWVVAEFAPRFGARRRQGFGAGLRVDTEHVLGTDLAVESTESVQDVLLK